jgi:hypothetical protein
MLIMKTLAEIEADIAALTATATTLREQAKAQAKPRLEEIVSEVNILIAEAVGIAKMNAMTFKLTLSPKPVGSSSRYSYDNGSFIEYTRYDQWVPTGTGIDASAWESSSSNC